MIETKINFFLIFQIFFKLYFVIMHFFNEFFEYLKHEQKY